jgi:hypothetical protein
MHGQWAGVDERRWRRQRGGGGQGEGWLEKAAAAGAGQLGLELPAPCQLACWTSRHQIWNRHMQEGRGARKWGKLKRARIGDACGAALKPHP